MIEGKGQLDPVASELAPPEESTCIVDQNVQAGISALELQEK